MQAKIFDKRITWPVTMFKIRSNSRVSHNIETKWRSTRVFINEENISDDTGASLIDIRTAKGQLSTRVSTIDIRTGNGTLNVS